MSETETIAVQEITSQSQRMPITLRAPNGEYLPGSSGNPRGNPNAMRSLMARINNLPKDKTRLREIKKGVDAERSAAATLYLQLLDKRTSLKAFETLCDYLDGKPMPIQPQQEQAGISFTLNIGVKTGSDHVRQIDVSPNVDISPELLTGGPIVPIEAPHPVSRLEENQGLSLSHPPTDFPKIEHVDINDDGYKDEGLPPGVTRESRVVYRDANGRRCKKDGSPMRLTIEEKLSKMRERDAEREKCDGK